MQRQLPTNEVAATQDIPVGLTADLSRWNAGMGLPCPVTPPLHYLPRRMSMRTLILLSLSQAAEAAGKWLLMQFLFYFFGHFFF